jgi:hypothetical protein
MPHNRFINALAHDAINGKRIVIYIRNRDRADLHVSMVSDVLREANAAFTVENAPIHSLVVGGKGRIDYFLPDDMPEGGPYDIEVKD